MKTEFKKRLRRTVLIILAGYILTFSGILLYNYNSEGRAHTETNSLNSYFSDLDNRTRNIATEKIRYQADIKQEAAAMAIPAPEAVLSGNVVKYEKTASVNARSNAFDNDEKRVRAIINTYKAVIQYEQNEGKKGNRELHLQLGVTPETFDSVTAAIKNIGKLKGIQVTKTDRTNEYHELNAKRVSLEKIRASLTELKSKGGKIEEYMSLDNRILEIEEQLQDLGVSLGDFDNENQFCTVEYSLVEGYHVSSVSFWRHFKIALELSFIYYGSLLLLFALVLFCAFFLLLVIDKLKLLNIVMKSLKGDDKN